MKRLLCWLVGHDPIGGVIGWPIEGHPGPEPHYVCERCLQPIYFWTGQRTGWFTRPEGADNAYRGSWLSRHLP